MSPLELEGFSHCLQKLSELPFCERRWLWVSSWGGAQGTKSGPQVKISKKMGTHKIYMEINSSNSQWDWKRTSKLRWDSSPCWDPNFIVVRMWPQDPGKKIPVTWKQQDNRLCYFKPQTLWQFVMWLQKIVQVVPVSIVLLLLSESRITSTLW